MIFSGVHIGGGSGKRLVPIYGERRTVGRSGLGMRGRDVAEVLVDKEGCGL